MKAQILDNQGKKTKEITTGLFEEPIREDMIFKTIEAEKMTQPYRPKQYAGMNNSASGNVSHKRHSWGSDRGRGMSRIPKKTMSRRGTQFTWIGAVIPSVRGGRRAHPPKGLHRFRKINKKEEIKTLLSTLTYVSSIEEIKKKYATITNKKVDIKLPIIIEDKVLTSKTKDFLKSLKAILGETYDVAIQEKTQRAGRGKFRGRRNKKNAGALIVISKNENIKISRVEVLRANNISVSDLATNGARLTIFSENAIKELEQRLLGGKK